MMSGAITEFLTPTQASPFEVLAHSLLERPRGSSVSEAMDLSSLKERTSLGIRAALIVAHPDDETLWSGGMILMHPEWQWFIVSICRGTDPDRAPRFHRAVSTLGARGQMSDLDDGAEQMPLSQALIQREIVSLTRGRPFDLIITHGPRGEYTRHRRHEETSTAVATLWETRRLPAEWFLMFAYQDGDGSHLPRAVSDAHIRYVLTEEQWQAKYRIITEVYGFRPDSFEARTTPAEEAFWCFRTPQALENWLNTRRQDR